MARSIAPSNRTRAALAIVAIGLAAGCGSAPPLANSEASADALMRQVLRAVSAGDRARLDALALDEGEFRAHVWPHLPAARPARNLPMSYVWSDLHQKSTASLARTLDTMRGRRLELVAVAFDDPPVAYGPCVVHGGTRLRVRAAGGDEQEVRVSGSLVELAGRWKVFSFVVDD